MADRSASFVKAKLAAERSFDDKGLKKSAKSVNLSRHSLGEGGICG
jgi:hypothetical protein